MNNTFIDLQDDLEIKNFMDKLKLEVQTEEIVKEEFTTLSNEIINKNTNDLKIEIIDKLNKEILLFLSIINKINNDTSNIVKIYFNEKIELCGLNTDIKPERPSKYTFNNYECKKIADLIKYMNEYRTNNKFSDLSKEALQAVYNIFSYIEKSQIVVSWQSTQELYESIIAFLIEVFNSDNDYYLEYLQIKYIKHENNIKIIEGLLGNFDVIKREEIIKKYNLNSL